jgi:hypothetical protein
MGNSTSKHRKDPTKDNPGLPPNILNPKLATFQHGSLLARLEKGESYESIKARGPLAKESRKKERRKRKENSRKPVELPAGDQVLTPNHELDSNPRIKLLNTRPKNEVLKE